MLNCSKATDTEEDEPCCLIHYVVLIVCGHIFMEKKKNYSSIQYVYFVLRHSRAISVKSGSTKRD